MIKTNDLRTGNFLKDEKSGTLLIVEEVKQNGFTNTVLDRSKYPLPDGWQAAPIPLTPEILEKCGFEQKEFFIGIKTGVYVKNGLKIGWSEDDIIHDQFTAVHNEQGVSVKVKHLHQLQNLYYALTGEELDYKQ